MPHMGRVSCDSRFYIARLVHNFKAVFFDDWIGQDFLGDAIEFFLRLVAIPAIQIKDKKLAVSDVLYLGIAKSGESVLDGLALGIEDGALWHHPNVGFHGGKYSILRKGGRLDRSRVHCKERFHRSPKT